MNNARIILVTPEQARERIASEGLFELKKYPGEGLCCVKGCRRPAVTKGKTLGGFWFCHKCWQARWRFNNPRVSTYRNLKDNARKRGLEFNLTYDYYLGMMDCAAAWDVQAETRGEIVTIDRVDPTKGYVMGNIRVVSLSENVIKGNKERYLPEHIQSVLQRKRGRFLDKLNGTPAAGSDDEVIYSDCPF